MIVSWPPTLPDGAPVRIMPRDMVTFPRGWRGRWDIHSYIRKRYAFFDGKVTQTANPKLQTPNSKPQTPNPRPQTPNRKL